jgi:hypothetical protein
MIDFMVNSWEFRVISDDFHGDLITDLTKTAVFGSSKMW